MCFKHMLICIGLCLHRIAPCCVSNTSSVFHSMTHSVPLLFEASSTLPRFATFLVDAGNLTYCRKRSVVGLG